ncbi:unnamed protein product [marine sediment metagenome]|uniref:Uncharacterized protein n=1 Tax=marine sediment metagenome TaxID=412755 RepID=X1JLG0_9ZZZZ
MERRITAKSVVQDLFDKNKVSFGLALTIIAVDQIKRETGKGATEEQVRKRVAELLGALANYPFNTKLLEVGISNN